MKIIIVGAGEVRFHIAGRLALENKDVVLIDNDMDSIHRVIDHIDVQTIHGSGSSPGVLAKMNLSTGTTKISRRDSTKPFIPEASCSVFRQMQIIE